MTDQPTPPAPPVPPSSYGPGGPGDGAGEGGPGSRRGLLIGVAAFVVLALVAGGIAAFTLLRSDGPDDAASRLLESIQRAEPDFAEQCELVAPKLRKEQLLEPAKVDDCDAWATKQKAGLKESDDQRISQAKDCTLTYAQLRDVLEYSYKITKVTEKGDTATVAFSSTSRFTGKDADVKTCLNDGKRSRTSTGTLSLRKYDGDWLLEKLPQ